MGSILEGTDKGLSFEEYKKLITHQSDEQIRVLTAQSDVTVAQIKKQLDVTKLQNDYEAAKLEIGSLKHQLYVYETKNDKSDNEVSEDRGQKKIQTTEDKE